MYSPTKSVSWKALEKLAVESKDDQIIDYFTKQPNRFEEMSLKVNGLFLDYSKNKVTPEIMDALISFVQHSPLLQRRAQMISGDIINVTENRPVLHTALRNRSGAPVIVNGVDVMPEIQASLAQIEMFSNKVRSGKWLGYNGKPIKHVVNIGIGGSDLGPNMVCRALLEYEHPDLKFHFVSNVDGLHIQKTLKSLNHDETLFIISSKTFSTLETQLNAQTSKKWFLEHCDDENQDISQHFIAVSTNKDAAVDFGIAAENVFEFWAWVGGRYSLWSSIGLPIALSIGYDRFIEMLEGAYEMDHHFVEAPLEKNLPVLLALIGVWNINFLGAETQAVIPYDQALHQLPAFLQQLDMESNGKSVDIDGNPVDYATGPIVWGQTGSNGQHAFFQLLHQGTRFVPIDFIASLTPDTETPEHNIALLTNMLAQAQAFMIGDKEQGENTYSSCPGNRPSNTILLDELSPRNLGALITLYEHKVFVQGVIWNINSFDQWGVQLGKRLASQMTEQSTNPNTVNDASTRGLLAMVKQKISTGRT